MEKKGLNIGDLYIPIPVIQGGMGVGISLSSLASSVSLAGGLGVLSSAQIGFREADYDKNPLEANIRALKNEVEKAKMMAKGKAVAINIMVATKQYELYVKEAAKAGIDLIISGAGVPASLPEFVKGTKTKIAPIVSSLKSARVILKLWDKKYNRVPDLLVIEGPKAGGHLGFSVEDAKEADQAKFDEEVKSILELRKSYEEKYGVSVPVAVAGGIFERKDMDHYLNMGADAVQMSTRFVTTYECDADEKYKMEYIRAKKEDIRIVKSPVGLPGRAIENDFIRKSEAGEIKVGLCHQCLERCDRKSIPYCITEALVNAAKGNVDQALLFCGENAWKCNKLEHVSDILKEFE